WKIVKSYLQTLRTEVRPTLRLALPLVLAELGWMSMTIVDTMMVGRLPNSAVAMGAVSLGSGIFMVLALFGEGLFLYFSVSRCLQSINMVRPVAFALVTANIINAVCNWILIYGKWGAPAMGTVGSGWSTAIARVYMAGVLIAYLFWYDRKHRTELLKTPVDIDLRRIKQL